MTTDTQAQKVRRKRQWLGAGVVVVVALSGVVLMSYRTPAADLSTDRWLALTPAPLTHQIGLIGKIEPAKTITLTAPFDGNVHANLVEEGQRVDARQLLLEMDPGMIQMQLRDALSAQLKARRTVQEMQDWDNGPQVSRARRSLRTSEMTLNTSERKLQESQNLFKRGIIPRNEIDDLEQQLRTQRLDHVAAQSELQQTLTQGKGEYRQIADMELTNATVKYEALRSMIEGKDVRAPFAGIVVPAPGANASSQGAAASGPVQAGSRVSQGQVLFGLANIEQLKIVSKVSELDINQLHQGQPVEILGDGFEGESLSGVVDIVSSLATGSDSPGASAQFPVTLSIPKLTHEQMQRVRLGMSARLTIVTYRNDQALIVPSTAIKRADSQLSVEYRAAADQPSRIVPVTVGKSTAEGVEVFGLEPGFVKLVE